MRHIIKYDYSSQIEADLQSKALGNPYVAGYNDVIDWDSKAASSYTQNYESYFYAISYDSASLSPANSAVTIYYSTDTGDTKTWTEFTSAVTLSYNKTYFKANTADLNVGNKIFDATANYEIGGNIMSLIFGDDFKTKDSYIKSVVGNDALFSGDTYLVDAYSLVINLNSASHSFDSLFRNCTSLTSGPEKIVIRDAGQLALPSTFSGCTSLTTAPEIIVENIAFFSFFNVFANCTNLNSIKFLLKHNNGAFMPFADWVMGVSQTGTFTKNKDANWWQNGKDGIPTGWTVVDSE